MHWLSVSLYRASPLYSFSQKFHTEERQIVRRLSSPSADLHLFSQSYMMSYIGWVCRGRVPLHSYLPEKERKQAQQQQKQDGQKDDPPRHSCVLDFTPLWEHRQFNLWNTNASESRAWNQTGQDADGSLGSLRCAALCSWSCWHSERPSLSPPRDVMWNTPV